MINISNISDELFFETDEMCEVFKSHPKLNTISNFSFDDENYPKKKTEELLDKAIKEINENNKINLLEECLYYDNTNDNAILENLKLKKDEDEKEKFLKKYGYHLSEPNYKKCFNKSKKGVIELYKELFSLFEKFRNENIIDVQNIWNFVKEFSLLVPQNTFTDESNIKDELFIHFRYLVEKIGAVIVKSKTKVYDKQMSFEEKLKKFFNDSEKEQHVKKRIELFKKKNKSKNYNVEDINNCFILASLKIFSNIFPDISKIIKSHKNLLYFCLENLDESNLYIFICIQELILILLMGKSNSKNEEFENKLGNNFIPNKMMNKLDYEKKIKDYIKAYNDKSGCVRIEIDKNNINNLTLKYYVDEDLSNTEDTIMILKDAYIYDWEKIIKVNPTIAIEVPLEYQFLKFIKIEYIKEFNFIKYTYGFIEELLLNISKSDTMISLLNEIYPGCDKIFNEKSDFLSNLIKKILPRCFYFQLFSFREGYTITPIKRISFFLVNTYNKRIEPRDYKKFLIVNMGLFIYLFFHEFFGHYLLHYLEIITKNKYNSPFSIIQKAKESGRFIEAKLFGKRIEKFTLLQLLYILDIDNYKKDYKTFNMNFRNIKKYSISENLFLMFKKHFNKEIRFEDDDYAEIFDLSGNNIDINNNNEVFTIQGPKDCLPLENNEFLYNLLMSEKDSKLFPILDD